MITTTLRGLLAALVFTLLASCRTAPLTTVSGPGADAPWPEQRAGLERLAMYSLVGRVAVAANGQGFTATLRYNQVPDKSNLALDGPLGIGGLRVALEGDQLAISTSRGEKLDGPAARAELERRLGFELPLAQLRFWLLGIPAPQGAASETAGAGGLLANFEQGGWRVVVNTRMDSLGYSLPQRLTVEREGARIKIVVDHWQP